MVLCISGVYDSFSHGPLYRRCLWFILSWSFVSQVSMIHSRMVLCIGGVYGSFSHGPLYRRCLWFILSWSFVSEVSMVHSLMVLCIGGVYGPFSHGPLCRRYRRRPTRTSVILFGISSTPVTSPMSWRKPGTSCVDTKKTNVSSFCAEKEKFEM